MDSYVEMEDTIAQKARNPGETNGSVLQSKMAELEKLKEKLKKAKDEAVQSWLDSRPLIDELEKLKSELGTGKRQTTISSTTISELESQLETVSTSIRSKKEEELKIRAMINKINQALHKIQTEMELLKIDRDDNHRARLQLKQVLRLRRQTLRTSQLTLRAIRLETEAYGASAAEAHGYVNHSQMDDTLVKLTQDKYRALIRKAKEETALAEWRISVSTEQKHAAEKNRDLFAKKLQNLYAKNRSMKSKTETNDLSNQDIAPEVEELPPEVMAGDPTKNEQNGLEKTQAKSLAQASQKKQQEFKRSKSKNKYLSKKKKSSIFARIRTFLVQKLRRYFR